MGSAPFSFPVAVMKIVVKESVILSYNSQFIMKKKQGKNSSRNLEARTNAEIIVKDCLRPCLSRLA